MNRSVMVAGLVAVVAIVAALMFWRGEDGTAPKTPEVTTGDTQTTGEAPVAEKAPEEPEPAAATDTEPAAEVEGTKTPSFDIVRVEPSGETVIAGRAEPGSEVEVRSGDTTIGKAKAGESGEWVLVPKEPLAPGGHELTLRANAPESDTATSGEAKVTDSDQVVVVVVPETEGSTTGAAEPEVPLALLTTKDGEGETTILQGPNEGISDHELVLNAVDYDGEGNVIISGRARPDALLIIYLDNVSIGRVRADKSGHWRIIPKTPISAGLHVLRVDMIGDDGQVLARVETPFDRAKIQDFDGERIVVVQPGNSLWRISRRTYGAGVRYTVIYKANQNQIRDPDLIYPGQIFVLPESE